MKGVNVIQLNHSTMVEALQLWCDASFKNPPRVTHISEDKSSAVFTVRVEEPTDKEGA